MNEMTARKGISGSTLKLIAITAMLLDHIGAAVVERLMMAAGYLEAAMGSQAAFAAWSSEHGMLVMADLCLRYIGRIAFPIFCFLLVEGFQRTRDVKKYALRLGLFALVSEVPFDLTFRGQLLEFGYQNVFFTLFLGLLTMIAVEWIGKQSFHILMKGVLDIAVLAAGVAAAEVLRTDYAGCGVLCIMAMYIFRQKRGLQVIAGLLALLGGSYLLMGGIGMVLTEITAVFGFLLIYRYNGERGIKLKYVFYLFYPVHLIILYGICVIMGIQGIVIS